ncbi:MAG: DUF1800 family protein [Bacteroidota bacterium]
MDRRSFLRRAGRPLSSVAPAPTPAAPVAPAPVALAASANPQQPLPYNGGLSAYVPTEAQPWDERRVLHLLRRTGYAVIAEDVYALLDKTPRRAVNDLVNTARSASPPPRPTWYDDPRPRIINVSPTRNEVGALVIKEALAQRAPGTALRERLTMLWANVIAAQRRRVPHSTAVVYRYAERLRSYALGNYRTLITEMGRDDIKLLSFLDGHTNTADRPNENYARELLELFTMGPLGPDGSPNYTQRDIEELARALTGWRYRLNDTAIETFFVESRHDSGLKTIFGRRGRWDYDDALRIIFEERGPQIAHYVCRRLYQEFVYDIPNEQVVAAMAEEMLAQDFVIEPVLKRLLRSKHFMHPDAFGVKIRSAFDLYVGFVGTRSLENQAARRRQLIFNFVEELQPLYDPPDVSGWPGFTEWVDTSTHVIRLDALEKITSWNVEEYRALGRSMPSPDVAAYLAEELAILFFAVPLDRETLDEATEVLLGGSQSYMWSIDNEDAPLHIRELVRFFAQLPEIHLC